jgi:cytochrome oxidase Cu insertion factor (SCO1/SenC/PrrC family)
MRLILAAGLFVSGVTLFAAEVPRQSPEFALTLPGGKQELLSKYKGKVIALEFLFTSCPHCQKSATFLSKLQRELGPKGFQAIGVAINPEPDLATFTTLYATAFPVGSGTRDSAFQYLQHSIMAPNFYVPQMVFIDKKGVIRGQYGGNDPFLAEQQEANIRGMVEKLLAESGGGKPAPAKRKPAKKVS